uniref:SPT2 chromatin protein n=1 Tax=Kalanchoe fedtschenkoi TaxID=63787 RepID=A0A7N0SYK3_KALFE
MRDYEDYEDLNEYEEDGYYEDDGEAGEEEYEQEEEPKLTQEQLEYLELRRKLKESYRKQLKKETGSAPANSQGRSRKDNFGSFFGPSQPVIAPRVIQESKSLLENKHLASRILNPSQSNKKVVNQTSSGIRPRPSSAPKVDPVKVKVQKLKATRDYSFLLSDDAAPPAPRKEPPLRKVSAPYVDKSRQPLGNGSRQVPSSSRPVPMDREERKPVSMNGKLQQLRPGVPKATSSIRQNPTLADNKRQHVSNGRPGQDRSVESKRQPVHNSNRTGPERPNGLKNIPSKMPNGIVRKTSSAPVTKSSMPNVRKPIPPRAYSQPVKQPLPQKKVLQDPYRTNMVARQPATSGKPQMNRPMSKPSNKPVKPISSQSSMQDRPKKRPLSRHSDDEDDGGGFDYRSEIRNMFRYNPNKFQDDDDTSDMEAGFDEILKEEERSALIAKKEDEIEQRLIEEEERRERMRKEAKRRKLSQR